MSNLPLTAGSWSHLGLKGFCMFYVKQFAHLQRWPHIFRLKKASMILFPMNMSCKNPWNLMLGFRQLTTSGIQCLMKGIQQTSWCSPQPVTFRAPPSLIEWLFWPFVRSIEDRPLYFHLIAANFMLMWKFVTGKQHLTLSKMIHSRSTECKVCLPRPIPQGS